MNNYDEFVNFINTHSIQDKDAESEPAREIHKNAKMTDVSSLSTLPETIKANRAEQRNIDIYLRDRKRAIKTLRKTIKGSLPEDLIFNQMISSYIRSGLRRLL